jgi:hypothetical protein
LAANQSASPLGSLAANASRKAAASPGSGEADLAVAHRQTLTGFEHQLMQKALRLIGIAIFAALTSAWTAAIESRELPAIPADEDLLVLLCGCGFRPPQ